MKKMMMLAMLLVLSKAAFGAIEIAPFWGYSFGSTAYLYNGDLKLDGTSSYGINLSLDLTPTTALEFQWAGASPKARWYDLRPLYPNRSMTVHYNYFLLGAVKQKYFVPNKVAGFGTFKLGMSYFTTNQNDIENDYRFAASLGGGMKIFFNDKVGLRLQGNLHLPMYFDGIWIGGGSGGVSGGVGTTSILLQGETSAGIIIKVGGAKKKQAQPAAYQPAPAPEAEPMPRDNESDNDLGDKYK